MLDLLTTAELDPKSDAERKRLKRRFGAASPIVELLAAMNLSGVKASSVDNLLLSPGLHVIMSDTGGGKSTLARNLAKQAKALFIEVDEPEGSSFLDLEEVADQLVSWNDGSLSPSDELINALGVAETSEIEPSSGVIVIDSFRLIQFEIEGAATAGAVAAGLYRFLTNVSIMAVRANVAVIATMNPLSDKFSDHYNTLMSRISSSVTTVVHGQQGAWMMTSRVTGDRAQVAFDAPTDIKGELVTTRGTDVAIVKGSRALPTRLGEQNISDSDQKRMTARKGLSDVTEVPSWAEDATVVNQDATLDDLLNNLNWSN